MPSLSNASRKKSLTQPKYDAWEGPEPAPGRSEVGNIDLNTRPDVDNHDGTHSSVRSMSFQEKEGGPEILVPTVHDKGYIMSNKEAIAEYKKTGRHLGKFDTPDNATTYANRLHEEQAARLNK